jgi:hypothetical protein
VALVGCTHVKDLWDVASYNWKKLKKLCLKKTMAFIATYNNLVTNMPWDPSIATSMLHQGNWVCLIQQDTIEWVYLVLKVIGDLIMAYEFKICLTSSKVDKMESQLVCIAFFDVSKVRVLVCKGLKGHYEPIHLESLVDFGVSDVMGEAPIRSTQLGDGKMFKVKSIANKKSNFTLFQSNFIANLPWDPNKWLWSATNNLEKTPFFRYSANKGYQRNKGRNMDAQSFVFCLRDTGFNE